jgi:phage tail sheath protein FI
MPTYLHPGVYVEEVSGGARPIEAVGTSTAAFVGIAEKGPVDEPRFITNFTEFQQIFGGYVRDNDIGASYLAYSVFHFFQNGGTACYVVRVEDSAKTATLDLNTSEGNKTMTIEAISPGSWGNDLRIAIGDGTTSKDRFNMYVFVKDELVETYEDLSMVNDDASYVDRVTKRSMYIRTKSEELPDNPTFTGKKDISGGVNLLNVKNIKLTIDKFGPYEIDCSENALSKAAVTPNEICNNINKAFQNDIKTSIASVYTPQGTTEKRIKIVSPTADSDSKIVFSAPANKDATYDIFGLQEYSWLVKGSDETIALAYGLETIDYIHTNIGVVGTTVSIGLGTALPTDISLTQGGDKNATLFGVVSVINSALGKIAFTDSTHIILKSNQDIKVKQTNADKILGGFYSYVHSGSGSDPAKIQGSSSVNLTSDGDVRLKIDNFPSFIASLKSGDSAETVASKINTAFQKITKIKKNIAENNGNILIITSITTGTNGRILVSSHTGTDVAGSIFGTAHKNSSDYLIPHETQSVAKIEGSRDLSGADPTKQLGTELAGKTLRISVGQNTVQFPITAAANEAIKELFTKDFAGLPLFNFHMLTSGTYVDIIAASTVTTPELYFSIPLKSGSETEEAVTDTAAQDALNAYTRLFGNAAPFSTDPVTQPKYTYEIKPPNNNPKSTVIISGEDMDFSQSLSLIGGDEVRSSESDLKNLTVGADGKSGLRSLDKLTDISILVIPGWEKMTEPTALTYINEGTSYCDKVRPAQARPLRDLFLVTNTSKDVTDPSDAKDFVQNKITYKSSGGYAGIYYPWVEVNDPIGTASSTILMPPAGSIAGLYASIDGRRGVWKAPAGTEAGVAGVVKLADQVSDVKQDLLNPFGVNAIRKMPGAGIVSWGARTLATNPEWKYIPVRRTAIMLEVSIYEGIQWAVFEPNDEPLWSLLRLNIGAFMMNLFRSGTFQGSSPDEAFFVKCDKETTTQVDIDLGKVNILVGFAPLKPAEFVIVKISQKAGQKE